MSTDTIVCLRIMSVSSYVDEETKQEGIRDDTDTSEHVLCHGRCTLGGVRAYAVDGRPQDRTNGRDFSAGQPPRHVCLARRRSPMDELPFEYGAHRVLEQALVGGPSVPEGHRRLIRAGG